MNSLVIAEHDNTLLSHSTLPTITAAAQLNQPITVLIVGFNCQAVAIAASECEGVQDVIVVDNLVYEHQLAENTAPLVASISKTFSHLLAPAGTFGKDLMPRVAALLDVGQSSDVIQIIDDHTFIRPIYAGNALATISSLDPIKILTIRTTAFTPAIKHPQQAVIAQNNIIIENQLSQFIDKQFTLSERPDLTAAKIIISGGRGLQNADNFKLLEQLASQLGAAIGASRAAVDAGFVPNDYQVGQTGKVVAPQLYIAIGISGAIQHIAGMKESKVIVAINKDPEAPIFAVADYGLVGDLFKILPELQQELTKLGYAIAEN